MIPHTNPLIVAATWAAARGALNGLPKGPGLCLAFVRLVTEAALGHQSHELYARYLGAGTTHRPGDERVRLPGDLIFNHNAAKPFGHVGILLDHNTVIEKIDHEYRPGSILSPGPRNLDRPLRWEPVRFPKGVLH